MSSAGSSSSTTRAPSAGDGGAADADAGVEREGEARSGVSRVAATAKAAAPPEMVRVEPPDLFHDDWHAWFRHLEAYSRASKQLIRVREVMSCVQRNKRLGSSKAALRGERVRLVPEHWRSYQRTYICTHGWGPRHRGENVRQRRQLRNTECPFRFVVQMVERGGAWCLKVKNGLFHHNHNVDDDRFGTYSTLNAKWRSSVARRGAHPASEESDRASDVDDAHSSNFGDFSNLGDFSDTSDTSASFGCANENRRAVAPCSVRVATYPAAQRSSIGSRRVSLSSSYGGGDEAEWEGERRRRAELVEREVELRVESLRCDNVLKRIRIVEESMLARKRLKDAGISESELNVLIPVVAVHHLEHDVSVGLRQLGTLGQTLER